MNEFTFVFLAAMLAGIGTQWVLCRRHILHVRKHRAAVPLAFSDRIPLAAHQKAADYTEAKVRLGMIELVTGMVILLIWTLGGALQWLDNTWRNLHMSSLWTGTAVILSFLIITAIIDLPLSWYRTFNLEQRFGFNKSTPGIFFTDIAKNMLLGFFIGTPILLLVLWIMDNAGAWWWIYVWLTWFVFSIFMVGIYPTFIAPLFNKFRPLENPALKKRVEDLLTRNGFTSKGIFVMDGSTRSTHGNAYFTGLGANKRIVFFDTLINELSPEEIEAVLAHELGHFKCNHIRKRMITLGLVFFAGLALLGWLINMPWFYAGLGIKQQSPYIALLLFGIISPVFTFFLQPVFSHISRRHEYEADDFAAAQAQAGNLVQALVKLYRENANTLTPDPLFSAFHDSHPPAPIRIAHLNARLA
jgi:STE24 endopeptidase